LKNELSFSAADITTNTHPHTSSAFTFAILKIMYV